MEREELKNRIYEEDRGKFSYDIEVLGREGYLGMSRGINSKYYLTRKGNRARKKLMREPSELERIAAAIFIFLSIVSIIFFNKSLSFTGFSVIDNLKELKLYLFFPILFLIICFYFIIKILRKK